MYAVFVPRAQSIPDFRMAFALTTLSMTSPISKNSRRHSVRA